ncbi:MAG: hypothetical protein R3F04_16095 [Lysobacteraceae bacterium]
MKGQVATIFLVLMSLVGCANVPTSRQTAGSGQDLLTPQQAIFMAASVAPASVDGVFAMRVQATGTQGQLTYLNSELDYRDQRNLTVTITPDAARQLTERFGDHPRISLKDKTIRVRGSAIRTTIHFYANGKPTGQYYYQTQVNVTDARQIEVDLIESKLLDQLSKISAEGNFVDEYVQDVTRLGLEPLSTSFGSEQFRVEVIPAFSRSILIDVRLLQGGDADVTAYEVPWDHELSSTPKITQRHISRRQVNVFRRLIEMGEFWTRYYFGWGHGLDTRAWVFEGVRGSQHHFFSSAEEVPAALGSAGEYLVHIVFGANVPR